MSKAVWKYEFLIGDEVEIRMPIGAKILHVAVQGVKPCIWALVGSHELKVKRRFAVRGTGHSCDDLFGQGAGTSSIGYSDRGEWQPTDAEYVGTFMTAGNALVFHLFDRGEEFYGREQEDGNG